MDVVATMRSPEKETELNRILNIKVIKLDITKQETIVEALKEPYRDWETDRKSTRLNSSHSGESRMPSSA